MSIKKANKFFNELDRNQQVFVIDKQINASYSIGRWIKFLSRAVAYDTYGDKATATLKKRRTIFFVILFGGLFLPFLSIFLIIVPIIGVILLLMNRKKLKIFEHRDLNNSLRQFFFPVLQVLKDMAGEEAKLTASLDFSDPRSKQAEKSKAFNRNISTFEATYIMGKVRLKDKANLEFIVGDQIKDMNWTKTSASGKTKYKNKSKVTHSCLIKLTVSKTEYPGELPDQSGDVFIEHKGDLRVLKTKAKVKRTGRDHILEPDQFFRAIKKIYTVLTDETGAATASDHNVTGIEDDGHIPAMIFANTYFDDYDYDSFDYEDSSYFGDEEDGTSIFDS
ncbi:MAG: hypothetical protein AAFO69_18815 [Bacteroidota bacterium]